MKKKVLATFVALACALSVQAQNILIANNNSGAPTGTQVYTTLQDAIDAAVTNDIIHVVPSTTSYGDVTISTSNITLQGVGLNANKAVGTKSITGGITVSNGVSGLKIAGLTVDNNSIVLGSAGNGAAITGIIIENCRIGHVEQAFGTTPVANVIIRNNALIGTTSGTANADFDANTSSIIITNNIIMGYYSRGVSGDGLVVENNLFLGSGTTDSFGTKLHNSTVRKNIFYGSDYELRQTTSFTGNAFEDNVGYVTGVDTVFLAGFNGNTSLNDIVIRDLGINPLFSNLTMTDTWQDELDFTLDATSVANDPTDATNNAGPSGGSTPYNSEGTSLPLIERLTAPSVIQQGENLDVRIQASGN